MSSCRAVFTGTKMVSCMMNITDVKCLNFDLYQKRALGWQGSRLAVDKTASRRPGRLLRRHQLFFDDFVLAHAIYRCCRGVLLDHF